MLSCSPCSIRRFPNCVPGSYAHFAIVPESGARSLRLRFIVYVLLSLFFGFLIPRPSSPFYEIRDVSCLIFTFLVQKIRWNIAAVLGNLLQHGFVKPGVHLG